MIAYIAVSVWSLAEKSGVLWGLGQICQGMTAIWQLVLDKTYVDKQAEQGG